MLNRLFSYTLLFISCSMCPTVVNADNYFDPNLIEGTNNHIDLSVFTKAGGQAPGAYFSEVYLNSTYIEARNISYENMDDDLVPLLTKQDYIRLGVKENATPTFMALAPDTVIKSIEKYIPDAGINFNFTQQRLDISVPQLYINSIAQGAVPPEQWDEGINAFFVDYSTSFASTKFNNKSGVDTNAYINLRSGVNLGAWRLRNYSTYTENRSDTNWNNISTYAQRDIKSLRSQLIIGDSYTPSDMFDSFAFRGVQLYSDDSMQPASLRGFAPVIRGIAQTNAQVTIRQNGNVIWQSYVPPGPFAITDLYPTSASGNLEVTVKEADGKERQFIQPFSSVPIMVREGRLKYSVTAGQYRAQNNYAKEPNFVQVTAIYGLPHDMTVYGGTILSTNYKSAVFGIGKSLGNFGSISIDTTVATAKMQHQQHEGLSTRFQYAKDFTNTGTTFTLAGYRYSTSNYRDFDEANGYYDEVSYYEDDTIKVPYGILSQQRKRNRLQLNVSQTLGDYGSLYTSAYQQDYWNNKGKDESINFGYNKSYKGVNYTFNYNYSRSMYSNQKEQLFSINVQIPFELFGRNSWLNLSSVSNDNGINTTSVGLSGTTLADNNLSYSVQQSVTKYEAGSGSSSLNYKTSFGEYQAGFNYNRNSQQLNYGARGGVIVHADGINFTQPLGDTMALVKAEDAADAKVINNTGIYTNKEGYAVIPYVTPYQHNRLRLDTSTLGDDVDILVDTKIVTPTRGAIVMADFPTRIGRKVLLTLKGMDIPFGAEATVKNHNVKSEGIVDNRQQVYLSGVPLEGTVQVKWARGQCKAPFKLPVSNDELLVMTLFCERD